MRAAERRKIRGRAFEIKPLGSGASLKVLSRLARVAGPVLGSLVSGGGKALDAIEGKSLGEAIEGALARLQDDDLEGIGRIFAEVTMAEPLDAPADSGRLVPLGKHFDDYFAGDMELFFLWLRAAAEVSFGPLWSALGSRLAARPGASAAAPAPR